MGKTSFRWSLPRCLTMNFADAQFWVLHWDPKLLLAYVLFCGFCIEIKWETIARVFF